MKRLIVCCDGTWNRADQARDGKPCPTNVLRAAYHIAKRDTDDPTIPQILFYDQGVGTGNAVDRMSGGAFGHGLKDNIFDAYRFLVANYEEGDDLFFFGFSRGAYTARSLAGMVRNCGILKRTSVSSYLEALALYQDRESGPEDTRALEFKRAHSVTGEKDIPIRFIGVWDTVGSMGIPLRGLRWLTRRKYQFHDVQLSKTVRHACHALAIDERRAPFAPTLWFQKPKTRAEGGHEERETEGGQIVEQRWFCGVHSDVGGGYEDRALSDLTLEWMLERAGSAGLKVDPEVKKLIPTRASFLGELHKSKKGMYRVTMGIDRPIGLGPTDPEEPDGTQQDDPTQSIDDSVLQRWDEFKDYRPPQLRAYFRRKGDRRANA